MKSEYEVIIIGGGPAGLTAGMYLSRDRRETLLIEKGIMGGMITYADQVENYPGFPEGVSGMEIGELMTKQATKFGLENISAEVTGIELGGKTKLLKTTEGNFTARAIVVASGSELSKLGVPGEDKYVGKGVSYCATCDAAFFQDLTVAVVGGGNAAVSEAVQLARFASKVIVIHRRDQLRATRVLQEKALAEPKIQFVWNTTVEAVEGTEMVTSLKLRDVVTGKETKLAVSGAFIAIGFKPSTDYLKGILPLDEFGRIVTNDRMETGVPGILAAGAIRSNSIQQVVASAGDGATAAVYAQRFLSE